MNFDSDEFYISLVGEIFDGYSSSLFNDKDIFVKHLNIRDQRYIHKYYEKYKNQALIKGVESEVDILERLKSDKLWDEEDDQKILSLENEIKNLRKTKDAVYLPSKKQHFQKTIDDKSQELFKIKKTRDEMVGTTAEAFARSRSSDEMLRFSLFKNEQLTEFLFSQNEFAELESYEINKLAKIVRESSDRVCEENIKTAVLKPFFSMYLSNCENISDFYGKPIIELSVYQLKLAVYGKVFNSIFQYVDDIPDEIREDPDKLLAFSESQRSVNSSKSKSGLKDNADASAIFGATKEDISQVSKDGKTISLSEELKKAGGKLDMKQMMKLAGHDT